jgi:hypothetical protein
MIMNSSNFSWRIEVTKVVNVVEALHNSNGIIKISYEPYLIIILALESWLMQGLAKVWAKSEAWESHFMLPRI